MPTLSDDDELTKNRNDLNVFAKKKETKSRTFVNLATPEIVLQKLEATFFHFINGHSGTTAFTYASLFSEEGREKSVHTQSSDKKLHKLSTCGECSQGLGC